MEDPVMEEGPVILAWIGHNGRPHVLLDEDLEDPYTFPSLDKARAFVKAGHASMGMRAAMFVIAVDVDSGETEELTVPQKAKT
jgi:hypothetical protein